MSVFSFDEFDFGIWTLHSLLFTFHLSLLLRSEPVPILTRDDKRFDHLGVDEITVELIQFAQPEIVTSVVRVGAASGSRRK